MYEGTKNSDLEEALFLWEETRCVVYHPENNSWYFFDRYNDVWFVRLGDSEERIPVFYSTFDACRDVFAHGFIHEHLLMHPSWNFLDIHALLQAYHLPRHYVLPFDENFECNKHEKLCTLAMIEQHLKREKFLEYYPEYCHVCKATGSIAYQDHEGYWCETSCASCFDKGKCPRCMTATLENSDSEEFEIECSICKWWYYNNDPFDDGCCLPEEASCSCVSIRIGRGETW